MIDLHLHTTASDGRSTPTQLIRRVARAGIRTCAVTDHDTVGGWPEATAAAQASGIRVIPGIEITAVQNGLDLHMLGYFFDPDHAELAEFLAAQRADRKRRILEMLDRLADLGIALNRETVFRKDAKSPGKAVGRPVIARLMVATGHAKDIADAFDRYLAAGKPAFVARVGASPYEVIALIARAGGVVSLAHPGKMNIDDLIPSMAKAGLTAIEVFHTDHDQAAMQRYAELARTLGLAQSGGSDYHGPGSGRAEALGRVTLAQELFEDLARRAGAARRPS